ncbi:MAG: D-alanyl-D-alanine carboxypeptidase/D-alanyl-D-alanine-endopeptidase, partial [Bacteroidetes bacterium]|nr:D-alanyl-D-alanine carboxypeptidase/D-alanyl-D-alanine-endopeptidase [Bacteroidota bacterium]
TKFIQNSTSKNAIWALSVRDSTGKERLDYNSSTLITPASNLKLLTSAALFSVFGSDFYFKTSIYGLGELKDSVWEGDLYIQGSGDPSIGGELYNDDKWYVFDKLINQLKNKGIKVITGKIIGYDAVFDDESYPPNWSYDDLSFYYATELNALSFNRNCIDLTVKADGAIGSLPQIEWFPLNTDYVSFINEQKISSPNSSYDEYYKRYSGTNTIVLRSSLPQHYLEEESLSIYYPSLFFADTFVKYAQLNGIEVQNGAETSRNDIEFSKNNGFTELAFHYSKPFKELAIRINKESDNFYTEMLVKAAAVKVYGIQGQTVAGLQIIKDKAAYFKTDTTTIYLVDGSGMAFSNLITTKNLSQLLYSVQHETWFTDYLNTLSNAGIDGTLKNRFLNTSVQGNLMGKSGYISGARTLSGYLHTKSGNLITLSLATNHFSEKVSRIDAIHQKIVLWLYENY